MPLYQKGESVRVSLNHRNFTLFFMSLHISLSLNVEISYLCLKCEFTRILQFSVMIVLINHFPEWNGIQHDANSTDDQSLTFSVL